MADTPLEGIDWDSQKVQGPEDSPTRQPRSQGYNYEHMHVGQQWRDYLNSERSRVTNKHLGDPLDKRAELLADPEYQRVQHLSKLLTETHGYPGGDSFDHTKNTPRYQPLSTMDSARWNYDNDKGKAEQQGLDKLKKITSRREMPADYSMNVEKPQPGEASHYAINLVHNGGSVGNVDWSGKTGTVYSLSVDEPHRHLVPQLLSKAHEVSHEEGHTGPTMSSDLSAYSYRVMRKHAPDFIPEYTTVEGEAEPMYNDAVRAHQEAAESVKRNWEIAKPHLLAAIGNDGVGLDEVSKHESRLASLMTAVNGGRLINASNHGTRVRATNDMLFAKHGKTLGRTAQNALINSDEPLRKLSESDFSNELYGY